MKKWDEVIKEALRIYLHRNDYCYFFGAKGQVMTLPSMESLIAAEPIYFKRYTAEQLEKIKKYSLGKIGFDCSGFIGYLTGLHTASRYQIATCITKYADIYKAPAGSLLYKKSGGDHIGLDIGYGFSLSFDHEGDSCMLHRHKEGTIKWEQAGKLTGYIDYDGATER